MSSGIDGEISQYDFKMNPLGYFTAKILSIHHLISLGDILRQCLAEIILNEKYQCIHKYSPQLYTINDKYINQWWNK